MTEFMKHVAAFFTFVCLALPAAAQNLSDIARLDVLPGWSTEDGRQIAALRVSLAPGWKTYWRAPGDVGIPPEVSYGGSENLETVRMQWPTPDVFYENNMRSIGYYGQVVLPIELERGSSGPIRLAGTLSIGVCEDICVPVHLDFSAILPEGGQRDPIIVGALVDRPLRADEAGVRSISCTLQPSDHGVTVRTTIDMPPLGGQEHLVIEAGDPAIWVSEPHTQRDGSILTVTAEMMHYNGDAFAIDRSALRFTVLGDLAVDIRGCSAG